MLLYNGAMAYDTTTGATLFAQRLPFDTALGIVELSERMGCYIQAYPGMGYYCRKVTEYTRRYANSIRVEPTPVGRPLSEWMRENPSDMQKLLLIDTPEGADRAQAMLREAFPAGASFLKSKPHYGALWLCYCDPALGGCGTEVVIRGDMLRKGITRSCGCLRSDKAAHAMNEFWKKKKGETH
jgi:hypothetical protein